MHHTEKKIEQNKNKDYFAQYFFSMTHFYNSHWHFVFTIPVLVGVFGIVESSEDALPRRYRTRTNVS